jgi:hypothetical protein
MKFFKNFRFVAAALTNSAAVGSGLAIAQTPAFFRIGTGGTAGGSVANFLMGRE